MTQEIRGFETLKNLIYRSAEKMVEYYRMEEQKFNLEEAGGNGV
jgi:hypothetical protein